VPVEKTTNISPNEVIDTDDVKLAKRKTREGAEATSAFDHFLEGVTPAEGTDGNSASLKRVKEGENE
jgi:hypothetical protein